MTVGLVIENGTVVSCLGVLKTDIAVDGEKILALGSKSAFPKAERVIDANGKIVIPGGIDPHSHFELSFMGAKPPENWDVASVAAAIGGTTTTVDFASRSYKGEPLIDAVKRQFSRAKELSAIDYTTKPMVVHLADLDQVLDGMKEVVDYGIPSFKVFQIYTQQGWYANDWEVYSIFKRAKELDGMITIHAENCLIGEGRQAELVKQGKTDPKYHGLAKPNFVENLAIQTCMTLAEVLGTKTYIVHTTTKEGPGIIASYRRKGLPVFCETCTHYLWLTEDMFEPKFPNGIMYMCSPPIRKQEDVEALWEGIRDGTVHTVGSDHVAFTKKQKKESSDVFMKIPNGFPGCEVRVPVVFSEGVLKRGLSLQRFAEVVSTNAAKIFGFYPKKGVIAPGSDADIVIIDPNKKHSLNTADLHMGTDLSVFEGKEVTGWPVMTILRGKVIVENEKFVGKLGAGEFVKGKIEDPIIATV
ncbi:dihydropyrimidinase [Dehalococcoidia bacterium]|nr:dihydropyrimidinase [Dehalococcoidia bacterium]